MLMHPYVRKFLDTQKDIVDHNQGLYKSKSTAAAMNGS